MSEPEPFFQGFLDDYFAECDEHLAGATRALLALEASLGTTGTDRALIDELFRDFHSLKGISAMVELRPAEQLAHHLEDYLGAIRDREVTLTAAGIDVLKFVRRQPRYKDVPILILTTRGDDASRQTAQQAGATHYMTKPFAPDALAATVQALLADFALAESDGV